jgi:hypothetical protein
LYHLAVAQFSADECQLEQYKTGNYKVGLVVRSATLQVSTVKPSRIAEVDRFDSVLDGRINSAHQATLAGFGSP